MRNEEIVRAVLRHMRRFAISTGGAIGGTYIEGRMVSARELAQICELARERGWVSATPLEAWCGCDGVRYELTDAGRAEARVGEDRGELTLEVARALHTSDLRAVWGDQPLAQRQIELRETGGARVRGALVAAGHSYSGTAGWHIIPYVTPAPAREVGYVDTARGRAYLTGVTLDDETIVALTVPGQGPGSQASGAAAWSSPDVGRGGSTEAPDGWVQLAVDIRTHERVEKMEPITPRLVAYGLVTCYSRRGAPLTDLVSEWPLDEDQRDRVRAIARAWLESTLERLGGDPGYPWREEPAMDVAHAIAGYAETPQPGMVWHALGETGITLVADAAGDDGVQLVGAIARALQQACCVRLAPVAAALPEELQLYRPDGTSRGVFAERQVILRTAAAQLLPILLRPYAEELRADDSPLAQAKATLYERGAIVTDEGRAAGVTCSSPPPRPVAVRGEIDGREVWRVPFGAETPEGFSHPLVLTTSYELVCRPEDAEELTRAVLVQARGAGA